MKAVTAYAAHGEIVGIYTLPDDHDFAAIAPAGGGLIEGHYRGDDFIVVDGQPIAKQAIEPKIVGRHLAALPVPCLIVIEGEQYPCDDGEADLDFEHPGPYEVTISAVGYKPAIVTVE